VVLFVAGVAAASRLASSCGGGSVVAGEFHSIARGSESISFVVGVVVWLLICDLVGKQALHSRRSQ
jgi:hypothetical protein